MHFEVENPIILVTFLVTLCNISWFWLMGGGSIEHTELPLAMSLLVHSSSIT